MVWWVSWKDAGSDIPGSGQIHFKSEWSGNETVESSRSWFFGTKPNEDRGRRTPVQSMIQPDSSDQSLLECATEPVMTWSTDLEIQQHHAESIHNLVLIKILWSRSGHKITQRSDLFLRSTLSVILTLMELKFRSPLHLETTPMFGWSYPEAQIATWMSYDTRIQNILQETLKKPIMGACKKLMRNNRLLNRDLNAFLIWWPHSCSRKSSFGNGKTSLPLSTATKMSWDTVSQYLLENGYVTKIAVTEKQMEQFTGDRHVGSWNLRSWSKQEIPSLTEIGSITSGREAARHDFSIARILPAPYCTFVLFKDTLGEIWSNQRWWVMSLHLSFNWKQFVFHQGCSFNFKSVLEAGLIAGRRESREGRQTVFFTPLDPWGDEIEEFLRWRVETKKGTLQDLVETLSGRRLLDPSGQGTGKRHNIVANKIACHHCSQDSGAWLYRESDWDDFRSTTLYTKASSKNKFSKNTWNQRQQQQQQQGDLGSFRKLKRERHEGDNNRVEEVAGNCNENSVVREKDSFQVHLRVHGVVTTRHLQWRGADDKNIRH